MILDWKWDRRGSGKSRYCWARINEKGRSNMYVVDSRMLRHFSTDLAPVNVFPVRNGKIDESQFFDILYRLMKDSIDLVVFDEVEPPLRLLLEIERRYPEMEVVYRGTPDDRVERDPQLIEYFREYYPEIGIL